jgi:hypothetical protein
MACDGEARVSVWLLGCMGALSMPTTTFTLCLDGPPDSKASERAEHPFDWRIAVVA